MVQALLRGTDILETALGLLRARLRSDKVSFISNETAGKDLTAEAPAGAAPVAWGQAHFGKLLAPGVPAPELAHHAAWLAGWLRLRDQQAELRTAAFRDPLTGAWNRRYFDRFLASAMEQCRTIRRTMTLMVFDIDDFKKYNDRYGHAAGDEILAETVRLMTSVVRPSDRVCRIGGDEFGVIFFEPEGPREQNSRHPDSVCKIAARFQQQIGRHRFPKLGSEAPGSLTISGGLATYPWDGATVEQLMARADERSMESKKCGKNALTLGPSAIRKGE
jgi:diguanylate cyclase (GGDEF)-like protein